MKTPSSDLLANLSPAKRLLLEKRLRGEKIASSVPALVRVPRNGAGLPLSYGQQRLWFIDQLTPGRSAYNIPGGMRLEGPLNVDALRKSLEEVTRRHESLRTRFIAVKGEPQQVIDEKLILEIPIVDLTGTPENQREAEARRWAGEEARKPFDLEHGPLFKMALLRLGDRNHILLLVMHHVISDGWSAEILVREFAAVYAALSSGRPSPLPELPVQYADYSVWQRSWLKGPVLEEKLSYWKQHLAGTDPAELATDRPRPAVQGQSGASLEFELDHQLTESVRQLSRSQGGTLYMTMLAALQLLIYRYSGQSDVLIGSPVAGRTQSQVEGLIGLFVNTLVLRTNVRGSLTFTELLGRVKKVTLEAFGHQDVPFEKLVDALQLERDLSRSPLFQVAFAMQGAPPDFEIGGVKVRPYVLDNGTAKFDLTFLMSEASTSIQCWLEYSTELFDEASAMGMIHHVKALLHHATQNPGAGLDELPLLTEAERRELLERAGSDLLAPKRQQTICALLAAYAEQWPDALALVSDGARLSYQELHQRICQLALQIRELRLEATARVGICLQRGADQVMAALAVLKAGGIFVPLDTEEAPPRLSHVLADTGISAIVTEAKLSERISSAPGLRLLLLEDLAASVAQLHANVPDSDQGVDSMACILYRSGPAGRPEHVLVTQRALLGFNFGPSVDYVADDRIAHAINFSHDAGCLHVFSILAAGCCAVNLSQEPIVAPREIAKILRDERVSVLCSSPAQLERLARSAPGVLKKLRLVLCDDHRVLAGGLPEVFRRAMPERFFAIYGASEIGAWPWLDMLHQNSTVPSQQIAQGARIYVLDRQFEPTPYGVVGEIYIGTDSLALGYEHQPGRTAETFIPDLFSRSFSQSGGARLYRTGDLGRRRHDGRIQFCGRRDGRTAVSGTRIHPKEIEQILLQHEGVKDAAFLVRDSDAFRDPDIELFVVPAEKNPVGTDELRQFLQKRLPEFMLPSGITVAPAIPRTLAGDPDSRVLARMLVDRKHVAPRNPIEEVLCSIWAKLLNRERVGVHDNFFEMGGDSILSVQVIAEVREAGLQITPKQIFEQQTIARLAEVATVMPSVGTEVDAAEGSMTGPVPMTPIQKQFFEWDLEHPEHFSQVLLLRLKPGVNSQTLEKVWTALLQHHDALRMRYEISEVGWKQSCAERIPEGTYRRKDLSSLEGDEQRAELERDAIQVQSSFDLEAGRLVAAAEYDLGAQNGRRLLLVIHHLVIDGISWRILLQNLERGYEQLPQGGEIRLGAKTSSYKKWTEGIQRYSEDEQLLQEATYWTRQPHGQRLPRDFESSESENTIETRKAVTLQLEKEETRALLQDVPGVYHTQINDVLLTALGRVCGEWNGGQQTVVDLEGHGREELIAGAEVSGTVGWFATIHPVALSAYQRWEPGSAIKATKEHLRAVPNHGFGYGVLRYISANQELRRQLATAPRSEILFNYMGQVDQAFQASRLFLPAEESVGSGSALTNQRTHVLEVTAIVAGGQLQISWNYSDKLHRRETIERIAQQYLECLQEIIEHCRSAKAGGYTPSDFPGARLRQQDLDTWIGRQEGIEDIYGLSPMQQGMLFHSLYESGSGVYFVQIGCEIYGGMEAGNFRSAWESVVRRHKILRTEFLWEGLEESVQVVRANVHVLWREEDWRGLGVEEQKQQWQSFLKQDRQQGFDLGCAPLLRFALFRTGEESYYFDWSSHHILMDGWCLSILLGEAITLYTAKCKGQDLELEPPRAYRDYIRWLRQQDEKTAEAFWREELKGFNAPNRLRLEEPGTDLPPGEEPYDESTILIAPELTQKLEDLARKARVTLNTTMQGAWAFLLSRYSGESDVVFGATVAGRSAPVDGIGSIVGLFINTIPARVQLKAHSRADETLAEYLKRLQNMQVRARQFEHCPLIKVQGWSEIQRGKPLFESIVIFENFPVDPRFGETIETSLKLGALNFFERTNYPFSLRIIPGKELVVTLIHDRRLFAKEGVERLLGHLRAVLNAMSAGLEVQVNQLSLLQPAERQQVLVEWNRTAAAHPDDQCIHELFAGQAAATPGATALEYQGERLTYQQLNQRANQYAHYLRGLGVGPEEMVAVCLERSAKLVAVLIGILKAGAAYVPLDHNYPAERLKYMFKDSKARLILTRQELLPSLPASQGNTVLLDQQQAEIERQSVENPARFALPENLAYVIYTSGSTGMPKGIGGTHRGMVNRIAWMSTVYPIGQGDVCCQKTTLSFADSIAEIFAPLLCGAPLKIVPEETAKDAAALVGFLQEQNVTRLVLVPSLLRAMLSPELAAAETLGKMSVVVTSGEALPIDLAKLAVDAIPRCALLNFYGSTEVSADATWFDLTQRRASDPVLIGKPIANMRAYVLDDDMQPSAIGITGELYIGGPGLARGYVNRGDLTAEKFVPDPFNGARGERLYRTGDLARWRAAGNLEFVGRKDHQVKVRGYRIELGEIEAALSADPAVAQAIVVAQGDDRETRLIAYVVPKEKTTVTAVREALRQRLPEYMLPSLLVILEAFPMTPSGKVDRRALPAPVSGREGEESGYVAPRTPVEELLAQVWTEVLRVEKIGANDHFFNLGGQSLLATQVVARVAKVFGVPLQLRQLFESPTIAGLATRVEQLIKGGKKDSTPPLVHAPGESATPLSYAQQRLWFIEQLAPSSAYNIPAAVRIRGPLDVAILEKALYEVVQRHGSLRTRFIIVEGEARQIVDQPVTVDLPILELGSYPEQERELQVTSLAIEEGRKMFDLGQAPLLRVKLLRLGEQHHVLLATMHHIISDAWSMGILVQEISLTYEAFMAARPSPLPELPIQYTDYSAWQRRWLRAEVLEEKLDYWRKQLAGMERLELPADRPRPAIQSPNGANREFTVPAELTDKLKGLARREGVTLYMLLLAAFQTLLYRYSRQADVVVGSPIAGRTQKETEGLIGFFVNMLVLRTSFAAGPGFTEVLRRVKGLTLEAYTHQEAPFERLVEEFEPDRDISRTPLFQVAFVLQNAPQAELALEETKLESFNVDNGTAKFDLTLGMGEGVSEMQGVLQYNTDLFEMATIAGMAQRFQLLFNAIVENPEQNVDVLPLISAEERLRLSTEWTGAPYTWGDETICDQMRAHAEPNGAALAVVEEGESLRYGELNRRANQLAHRLRKLGVRSGQPVGICLDKGLDWVIATLGILKAGAVFVPLEPSEPPMRFKHILQDASLRVVVTEENLEERFQLLPIETIGFEGLEKESSEEPEIETSADAPACILYRSGAIGTPEGIMLSHRALCAGGSGAEITASDRVAQRIDFSREASSLEVFRTLSVGACVVSIPRAPLPSRQVATLIRDHAATVLWVSAPVLERLASSFLRSLRDVRLIFCEDPISTLVQLAGALKPEITSRLYGVHADTEMAGRGVLYHAPEIEAFHAIPAGRLAHGSTLHLLDQNLAPVPPGLLGEIYIGSELLALGYDHQPARSAEAFFADPYAEVPGRRLYRTGELGRRRNDGRLELRGRRDGRMVVDGMRVEVKEIERALMQYPGIRETAVLVQEAEKLQAVGLSAFVVAAEGSQITTEDLRQFLRDYLPERMIPPNILMVGAIPRTTSGRVNQRLLAQNLQQQIYAAPKNRIEQVLSEIWANLLLREKVGIHDNFFRLGGDSILSIQVITQARQAGIQITPRQMFERQTIAELAEVATVLQETAAEAEETSAAGPVPLLPIQRAFFQWALQKPEHFNQAVLLELKPEADSELLEKALLELLKRHPALRMSYAFQEGSWQQLLQERIPEGVYRRRNLHEFAAEEQRAELARDADRTQGSLDLSAGRLLNAVEYDLGPEGGRRLLLVIHHLAVDGFSWRVLLEELEHGYGQLKRDESVNLGVKTTSTRRWVEAIQRHGEEDKLRQEVEYWCSEPRKQAKPIPRDYATTRIQENIYGNMQTVTVSLEAETTRTLLQEAPQVYHAQMSDVLLAAMGQSCGEWIGGQHLLVDVEGHGREDIFAGLDVSRTVGWFTSIYPVLLERGAGQSWEPGTLLKATKELLRNIPSRGFGYGVLRYVTGDEGIRKQLEEMPHPEILFNYFGQVDQVLQRSKLFAPADENAGKLVAPENRRPYLLEVNAVVAGGCLQVSWTYSQKLHRRETIERLAHRYVECLQEIIRHCLQKEAGGTTPSDFPFAGLNQEEVDRWIGKGSDIEDVYSLTPMQEGMLFHSLREPGSSVYFSHFGCRIQGKIDAAAFRRAWEEVVQRHAVLRTSFRWEGLKAPVQIVHKHADLPWRQEDWRGMSEPTQQQNWEEFLQRDRQQGLDFLHPPLMRVTLIRTDEESHYFVWGFGHILMDGWCLRIVLGEVFRLYEAYRAGTKLELSSSPLFRNYIGWLREQDEKKAEAFWRSELKGFKAATSLRMERERRDGDNGHGEHKQIRFVLERDATARLEELARAHQVTLNAVVQGAWGVLLSRYSGDHDVVFGATVAGRSASVPNIENMVGLFINTLPVRVRVSDQESVVEYLKGLQQRQAEARDVEYAPLVKVQNWSEVSPATPLFETLLVFENLPVDAALQQQLGAQIDNEQLFNVTNYPLALRVTPAKELIFDLIYRTQICDDKAAQRMAGHLLAVLQQMGTRPLDPMGQISLLMKDEQRQVVDDWNQDDVDVL